MFNDKGLGEHFGPWYLSPRLQACCIFPRNSGTVRRTDARPLGEEAFESVWMGNVLCARTLIVLLIAHSLGCWWILEQPKGSKMEAHPCFQDVLRWIHVWRQHISMGAFGAKSLKPTWLYSSSFASLFGPFSFLLRGTSFPDRRPQSQKRYSRAPINLMKVRGSNLGPTGCFSTF